MNQYPPFSLVIGYVRLWSMCCSLKIHKVFMIVKSFKGHLKLHNTINILALLTKVYNRKKPTLNTFFVQFTRFSLTSTV